jgi:hypothetical protein
MGREDKMEIPKYLNLDQARQVLAEMGVDLSPRQIKRAADPDIHGRRKLPFFIDPIEGKLKIEKGALVSAYRRLEIEASNNLQSKA